MTRPVDANLNGGANPLNIYKILIIEFCLNLTFLSDTIENDVLHVLKQTL
jgi:hypothetical protein